MLVGISEAARQLGVATETVRRMVKSGRWPAYRFGPKSLRIDVDEIKRLGRLKLPQKTRVKTRERLGAQYP